jgi:hypothetical protein
MENILMWAGDMLTTTPKRWMNLVEALPAELIATAPVAGEWSALECLQHMIDTEINVFPVRIKAMLAGEPFPAFNPNRDDKPQHMPQTPIDVVREFARLRTENLNLLAKVTPPDLAKTGIHPELGPVTLDQLIHQWITHDLNHTVQAERTLMQPFIEGCLPWRDYFKDHIMAVKQSQ